MLYGRENELAEIDRLLAGVREGRSGALVLHGEVGIGKSALLDHAASQANGMRVLRGTGVESESELPFAGMHLLIHPFIDRIDALPSPRAAALRGALGLDDISGGEEFLVGLGLLSLLTDLAREGPLLCLIDDAQWIDRASAEALLFAIRRLDTEQIAIILAVADGGYFPDTSGLRELRPASLDATDASALLTERAADMVAAVRDRIVAEARGNPLALIELSTALSSDQRSGRLVPSAHVGVLPVSDQVLRNFTGRIQALPERTQILLLLAAAGDTDEIATVLAAARRFGASVADLEPAEDHRLIQFRDGRLTFRHPLAKTAAYGTAPFTRRLAVHRALADTLIAAEHAHRRAWHLAAAADGPDEGVAAELERSGEQARTRGRRAAVAAAYERAGQLSPDPRRRAHRLAVAAQAAGEAGETRRAVLLADQAAPHICDPLVMADLAELRASVAHQQGRTMIAHDTLVEAATTISDRAPDRTAFLMLAAMEVAWAAGDESLVAATTARSDGLRLPATPWVRQLTRGTDGLAQMFAGRHGEGIPALRGMIFGTLEHALELRQRASIAAPAYLTGDVTASYPLAAALVRDCRDQDAIGVLPRALLWLARCQLHLGLHRDATASAAEGLRIADETTQHQYVALLKGVLAQLAAIRGDEEGCHALAKEVIGQGSDSTPAGAWCECALALLDLGLARYEDALRRFETVGAGPAWHAVALFHLPDRVEAAVRLGQPERAVEQVPRFETWADQTGQPWAAAVASRRNALLASGDKAESYYENAIRQHANGDQPFERARTELLFGEWLRRNRRRSDARRHLRSAFDTFQRLEAGPWADRARGELRAAGERQRPQAEGTVTLDGLTPQEQQVVRLAATGMSNRDIGARLFLSPRTVGYHLYKAFPKLGITSRRELSRLLPDAGAT